MPGPVSDTVTLTQSPSASALNRTSPQRMREELDLPAPPEVDLGTPPEFFDNGDSPGRLVEEPDQGSGEQNRRQEPRR